MAQGLTEWAGFPHSCAAASDPMLRFTYQGSSWAQLLFAAVATNTE